MEPCLGKKDREKVNRRRAQIIVRTPPPPKKEEKIIVIRANFEKKTNTGGLGLNLL